MCFIWEYLKNQTRHNHAGNSLGAYVAPNQQQEWPKFYSGFGKQTASIKSAFDKP